MDETSPGLVFWRKHKEILVVHIPVQSYRQMKRKIQKLEREVHKYKQENETMRKIEEPPRTIVNPSPLGFVQPEDTSLESEECLGKVVNAISDPIFVEDRQHRYVLANDAFCALAGCERGALLGGTGYDFFPEEQVNTFWERDEILFETGKGCENEELLTDAGGAARTVITKKNLYTDAAGNKFIVAVIRDITDRKKAETALRQGEEKYRQLFETESDAIVVFDVETRRFIDINEKACRLYGYSREEFLELAYTDVSAEPDATNASVKETLAGTRTLVPLRYHKKKDGTVFPTEISASTFVLGSRQVFCGVVRDITRRVQAERQLSEYRDHLEDLVRQRTSELSETNKRLTREIEDRGRAEQALVESQQMLQSVMDNIPIRVFWKDLDSKYLGCNHPFALDAGLQSPDQLPGRNDFDMGWAEQAELYRADDRQVMETGKPKLGYEERQTTPEGGKIWLRTNKVPLLDVEGRVRGLLGTYEDITESKRMEECLQKTHDTLERKVEERTAELEKANRELRQIPSKLISVQEEERRRLALELHDSVGQTLAAIKFWVEMAITLRDECGDNEALKHLEQFIPILQRSIEETRIIYMGLRPSMLDTAGLLPTIVWLREECMKLYPRRHIELEMDVAEEEIPENLKVNIFRIAQEALNNIAKHSNAEWVDISLSQTGHGIELVIFDDGVGMDVNHILETCTSKSLGLSSMRERAELTGGKFMIESFQGEGTTIRVCWPV